MVTFSTWLILVFMEISIFASLFTPPGLSRPHVPLQASNTQHQHQSAQGLDHANPTRQRSGRQGPKSLGGTEKTTSSSSIHGSTDVMVAVPCAGMAGAPAISAQFAAPKAKHSTRANKISTAKRAFKRAQRRAFEHGSTMYRGRICTAASLGCHSLHAQDNFATAVPASQFRSNPPCGFNRRTLNRPGAQHTHHKSAHSTRIKVFTLNLGGLCTATYDVLMQWLQREGTEYDVILLQETHYGLGREPCCYQVPGWTVCSSPDPRTRFSGVAVLVSARLTACADLQYHHVIPGRLLHVRLPIGSGRQARSLDVVSCYQHSWDADPLKNRLAHRLEFWHKLTDLVQALPKRNCHLIGGDFNCSLRPIPQRVGPGLCASGNSHPDIGEFCELISATGLCALNSWTAPSKAFTYQMPGDQPKRSHIDFLLVNKACADGPAKLAKPDHKLCFSPWRGGAKHYAVAATVRACFRLAPSRKTISTGFSREAFRLAVKAQDSAFSAFRRDLTESLPAEQALDPASLNAVILECRKRHFPSQPQPRQPRPWQCADIQTTVKDMWASHHKYRTALVAFHRGTSSELLKLAFAAFRCHAQFRRIQHALRKRGALKRRNLFLQDLDIAEQAANNGDIHLLYKQIRRLAPKTKHERIQLRQPDGKMLTKQAEFETIKGYFTTVFTRDRPENLAHPRSAAYSPCLERIEKALSQNRSGRAIPDGSVPPEVWHHCADILAPPASSLFQHFLTAGSVMVPTAWTECWLKLLPKPQKPAHLVANLRPIALQDPLGKTLARLIKQDIMEKILPAVRSTPQFAYLPRRSTAHAISRAAQFCDSIRGQLREASATVWTRKAGRRQNPYCGGAIFSLDMSKAFDMVSHSYLEQALKHLQIDPDLISLVLAIHSTQYHIEHGPNQGTIPLGNGIRQGCVLSPLLWVCVTHYMLHQLECRLTEMGDTGAQSWVRDLLTLFADDFLAAFRFACPADISLMCLRIGCLFQVLEASGMCINPDKSKLLFKASGRQLAKWLKRSTLKKNGIKYVQIGTPFSLIQVGLAQSLTYLGVVLSFDNFELQTMRHRLHQVRHAVSRLSRLLFKKRGLSTKHKLRVYLTCVRSTATYGIHVIGVTPKSLQLLSGLEARHLRCLAGIRRADEALSNEDLYARFSMLSVSEYLIQASQRRIDSLSAAGPPDFPCAELDLEWQRRIHSNLSNPISTLEPSNKPRHPTQSTFECPTCALSFTSLHALRTHYARKHKQNAAVPAALLKQGTTRSQVDIKQHCVHGMPTCKHCGQSFQKWHGFKGHILSACPVLHQSSVLAAMPSPAPVDSGPALQSAAGSQTQGNSHTTGDQMTTLSRTAPVTSLPASASPNPVPSLTEPLRSTQSATLAVADQPDLCREVRSDWIAFAEKHGSQLRQFCIYCTQWCSTAAGLKTHLRRAHPNVWSAHEAVNARMKQQQRLRYKGTCKACSFQPSGPQSGALHSFKCPAYFQACLLHYQCCPQEHVGRERSGERLWRPAQSSVQCGDEAAPSGGIRGARGATEVVPPCNQGGQRTAELELQRMGEQGSPERSGLGRESATDRHGERDSSPRTPRHADTSHSPPGRLHRRPASRYEFYALHGHSRRNVYDDNAVGNVPALEEAQGRGVQQGHPESAGHPNDGPVHGVEVAHGAGPGCQNEAYVREARVADRGGRSQVGLSDLGPRGQGHEDGPEPGSDSAHAHAEGRSQTADLDTHQPSPEVPCHSANGGGVPEQHAHDDDHDQQPRPACGRALRPAAGPMRQLRQTTAGASSRAAGQRPPQRHPATGSSAEQGRGQANGGQVARPANLVLSNPHNVCYINSVVTGLHWVSQHCQPREVFGSYTVAFQALATGTRRSPCYVPGLLPWLPLLRGWQRSATQHDACEFMTHLLSRISPSCFAGQWQSRLNDGDLVEIRGSGNFLTPLPMDLPCNEHASLQQIVNHWHLQDTTTALLHPPKFMLIQLQRYIMQGTCPVKLHSRVPLSSGARIHVPCFDGDTLSTTSLAYVPCFAIMHDGQSVGSGHYRCGLFPFSGTSYLSDDHMPPRPMTPDCELWGESRCYLICLRRVE